MAFGGKSARQRSIGETARIRKPTAESRARLLQAAERLFSEKGFDATSTKSVAEEAGVPAGLLFYYFPTKAALLAAVMERNNLAIALRTALREPSEGESAEQVLLEALTSMLFFIEKNHRWAVLFFREILADRDDSEGLRLQRIQGLKLFADWLERNIGNPKRKFKHSIVAAHILGASLMVAALVDRPKDKRAYASSLMSLLLHGGLG